MTTIVPIPNVVPTDIVIEHIANQKVGHSFVVNGTFVFTPDVVELEVIDDNGAAQKFVPDTRYSNVTFSFVHPAFKKAGTEQVKVGVAGGKMTATSNVFRVS